MYTSRHKKGARALIFSGQVQTQLHHNKTRPTYILRIMGKFIKVFWKSSKTTAVMCLNSRKNAWQKSLPSIEMCAAGHVWLSLTRAACFICGWTMTMTELVERGQAVLRPFAACNCKWCRTCERWWFVHALRSGGASSRLSRTRLRGKENYSV